MEFLIKSMTSKLLEKKCFVSGRTKEQRALAEEPHWLLSNCFLIGWTVAKLNLTMVHSKIISVPFSHHIFLGFSLLFVCLSLSLLF